MSEKIIIEYDDCGFTIKIGKKKFETDYCGFPRPEEIGVLKKVFKYLGHEVELIGTYDVDEYEELPDDYWDKIAELVMLKNKNETL